MTNTETRSVRRVAILQSCYIPWKGYFDIIDAVDVFVIYDDVQFVKAHWHNRNLIKTASGPHWLTIPVAVRGERRQTIDQVVVSQPFAAKHMRSIEHNYSRAKYFSRYRDWLVDLYSQAAELTNLSAVNVLFLKAICKELGIDTKLVPSSEFDVSGKSTDRLVNICQAIEATHYITGPTAKSYLNEEKFSQVGIELEWMQYDGYPVYTQVHDPFLHTVSIIDLILNVGDSALDYIKSARRTQ